MSFISDAFNRLVGKQSNPLDTYLLEMIANSALYPTESNETYLNSYLTNCDVFTVINKITEPASTVPVYQYDANGEIVENGKMLALLNKPNTYQSKSQFIESAFSFYYIFGESFTASQSLDAGLNKGLPVRLDQLPPKWMTVNLGSVFNPVAGYSFYPLAKTGAPDYLPEQVCHWKEFNPDYDMSGGHLRGMSRLRPLIKSVVGSTEAYNSLVKAFQNQGAWGLLTLLEGADKVATLNKEQLSEVRAKFKRDSKRGDITTMNYLSNWTKIGLTMVELEILKSIGIYKGNLCDAYNVPSQLLSGSQDRTYNNFKEAESALWRNAIQPSLDAFLEMLSNWLAPKFKEEGQVLKADYSEVSCLQINKAEMAAWMVASRSFSKDEIREALGYEKLGTPEMQTIYEGAGMVPLSELGLPPDIQATEDSLKNLPDYRKSKNLNP
jgi:HK97 family phage portal protein